MSRIFLIGFMGAGKTTVGSLLAQRLGLPFIDLDERIEQCSGRTIALIFERDGESAFRDLEEEELRAVLSEPDAVVSCGGGVVLRDSNRALLHDGGTVVYLRVSADEVVVRLEGDGARPLLAGDASMRVADLLESREHLYSDVSDLEIDTAGLTPQDVADRVERGLSRKLRSGDSAVRCVPVETPSRTYEVVIGDGLIDTLGQRLVESCGDRSIALITDRTVQKLYGSRVRTSLESAGLGFTEIVVEPGETSKNWSVAGDLLETMATAGILRGDLVVALGGGVIGDLAGFCAATYMRGIDFVQVPTTLLAQVDSSVGGKTGVDLEAGKNLAGAFHQPQLVLGDVGVLSTLKDEDWASGFAEVVKMAVLEGEDRLAAVERDIQALAARDVDAFGRAVESAVRFKADIVSADEREAGLRECLNLGHTFGHALESVLGYGQIPHGIAVAEGIRFVLRLGVLTGYGSTEFSQRVESVLTALGLSPLEVTLSVQGLRTALVRDKKARNGRVRWVLVSAPGSWSVEEVDQDVVDRLLEEWTSGRASRRSVR